MTPTPPGRVRDAKTRKLLFVCTGCGAPCQSKRPDRPPQCVACFNAGKRAHSLPDGKRRRPCRICGGPTYSRDQVCSACYAAYGLRDALRESAPARRGNGNYASDPPPPPEPTDALPGSFDKFRVLVERAESGYALWHPRDNVPRVESHAGHRNSGGTSRLAFGRRNKVGSDALNNNQD